MAPISTVTYIFIFTLGSTYSKIITKRAFFTALICQIVNQLAIFTIFASQDFLYKCQRRALLQVVKKGYLEFKDRCINSDSAMLFKDFGNGRKDLFTNSHFLVIVVFGTLDNTISISCWTSMTSVPWGSLE